MNLVTAEEVAEILKVSVQRVYELVRTNVLPPGVAIRLGRQVRIDAEELGEWLRGGGQALPGGWRRETDLPARGRPANITRDGGRHG